MDGASGCTLVSGRTQVMLQSWVGLQTGLQDQVGCKMCSMGAGHLWPHFPKGRTGHFVWQLSVTLNLLLCPGRDLEWAPRPVWPLVGNEIKQCCQLSSLARQGHQFGSADGLSCCLGSLLRHHCKQELILSRSECWLMWALAPFSISLWSPMFKPYRFPQWSPWVMPISSGHHRKHLPVLR